MTTGLLYYNNLNLKTRNSDKLFYNKFRFCFRFQCLYLNVMGKDFSSSRVSKLANMWHTIDEINISKNHGGSWAGKPSKQTALSSESRARIVRIADFFRNNRMGNKIILHKNEAYFYTNDESIHKYIAEEDLGCDERTEMIINRPIGTVKSRYKGYTQRSFFKQTYISKSQKQQLLQFINNNKEHIKINVGLKSFANSEKNFVLRDYYHFDSPGKSYVSMFELMCPGLIRKTLNIHYDK